MKYIRSFETLAGFQAAQATLDRPNVSLIEATMGLNYLPYVHETRVVCKYNVTSTSSPTTLRTNYENNIFKSMEIDDIMLNELVTEYTFDTLGVHTVKYELYDETKLGNYAPVFLNSNLVECIIPDSVTNIASNAFNRCSGLTSVTIPNSVTSIGAGAFSSCSLTSITIPDSVTSIGAGAFASCSLTSITIPDSVTSIGAGALDINTLKVLNYNAKCGLSSSFRGSCCNFETVIIGDSTPSIGDNALTDCSGLTSVTIGSGVTSIGDGAFNNCSGLTSIVIPNNVTSIGDGAFNNCSGLTSIVIPNNVISIGNTAFNNCSGLTSVTIPNSVTSIGDYAFYDCSSLTSIVSNATTAPTILSNTFRNVHANGALTVPSGSTGYDVWIGTGDYYLGKYNWTKVEQ